jgi:predicted RNA-binding Zn ribbon-like protein
MNTEEHPATNLGFLFLGDHLALDFLNTRPRMNGELVDLLADEEDVLSWLAKAGFPATGSRPEMPSLLQKARGLRECIRKLVEKRKSGEPEDFSELNAFLAAARSYSQLRGDEAGRVTVQKVWQAETSEQVLAPVAEAAAELLAMENFEMVRHCEDEACVLWFYDRTKSHHRRWCSMATCGNRHKVAAYRKRRLNSSMKHQTEQ